ncbi:aerobactin synthase IucC, partial [Yersinia pestis]
MITTDYANWQQVNRHMIAKILSELEYERTLHAELHGETGRITLPGAVYTFNGKRGIWGWLHIDPATLRCEGVPLAADHMLRQLALVLKMDDSQVAEHLEDLYATLRGDMQLLSARHGMSAEALIALNDDALQCLLAGHPKFIFNKGRRGWGLTALQHYAPEYQGQFRLHWVAAKRGSFIWCVDAEYPLDNLLNSAM